MAELFKLFLDAGHGGSDVGAIGNGLKEKDLTLAIAKKIRDILAHEYTGVAVRMSRIDDTFPTLKQRTDDANGWGAHFFLSIHINAFNKVAKGFETFTYPGTKQDKQNIIHDEIMKVIGLTDRGKKQSNLHVLRESKMPALLTENGFIDSSVDSIKMKDAAWIDSVARAHVTGLEKALNLNKKVVVQVASENDYKGTSFETPVEKAKKKGVMLGYDDQKFGVNDPLTRGQFVTVLDRLGLLD